MKKKWQKPTRREVRAAVQFSLMEITSTIGFSTVYLILLRCAGFQNGVWADVIAAICGGLSTFWLDCWVRRSDYGT